jgi:hypothetical protein
MLVMLQGTPLDAVAQRVSMESVAYGFFILLSSILPPLLAERQLLAASKPPTDG